MPDSQQVWRWLISEGRVVWDLTLVRSRVTSCYFQVDSTIIEGYSRYFTTTHDSNHATSQQQVESIAIATLCY